MGSCSKCELDAQQTPVGGHTGLPLAVTLCEGEHLGVDVGNPETDDHGLFSCDIRF